MADYGIKVSKDGYDISTGDDRNLVYSSKYSALKIFLESSVEIELTYDSGTNRTSGAVSVTHDLGYEPAVFGMVDFGAVSGPSYGRYSGGMKMLPIYVGNVLSLNIYSTTTSAVITARFVGDVTGSSPLPAKIVVLYDVAR